MPTEPDELDRAAALSALELERVLSRRVVYKGESAERCEECDYAIPEARRLAVPGVKLCVECQERKEKVYGP